MTDFAFPSLVGASQIEWTLERNVVTLTNPLSKTIQRIARGGDRWRATVQIDARDGDDARLVCAWLDQIARGDCTGVLPVQQNDMDNSESSTFVSQQGPWRSSGATGWINAAGSLLLNPYVRTGMLIVNSGSSGGYTFRTFSGLVPGLYYLVTADVPNQPTPGQVTLPGIIGAPIQIGRVILPFVPTGTAASLVLTAGNSSTSYTRSIFGDVTLTRCYIAQLSAPAGAISIRAGGGVNNGGVGLMLTHRAGQFVNIQTSLGWELKRLTQDVDMVGGSTIGGNSVTGGGQMVFEPALRGSVAANAVIRHVDPYARMLLSTPASRSSVTPPLRAGFNFDLIEDVT